MDLLKHGESAYPVDAWIELQYGGGGGDANGYLGATKHEAIALSIIVLHVRSPCKKEDDPHCPPELVQPCTSICLQRRRRRRRHSLALLPSHMKGHHAAEAYMASYNDPALMFPSAARLFGSANWIALATASSPQQVIG